MVVKEKVFNYRKKRYEEVNRFRNGDITKHLTSVDIEEIVRVSAVVIEFFQGYI